MLDTLSQVIARVLPIDALATELVAGGIGAILLAFVARGTRLARNTYLRIKFPVGGQFLTFFEDFEGDERIMVAGLSKLRQRGREITGQTQLPSGRTWDLKGRLIESVHVAGVYTATAPDDQGVGSFYLRLDEGDLSGVWTGYDHKNKTTTKGVYWFKRLARVRIRKYEPKYRAAVLDILGTTFGQGYLGGIDAAASRRRAQALVALRHGKVRGFAYGFIAEKRELKSILKGRDCQPTPDVRHADEAGTLGVIQTIAVGPKVQRRGVGTAMFLKLERALLRDGAEVIIVPAWRYDDQVNLRGVLDTARYQEWSTIPGFWKTECDQREFHCAAREGDHCRCDVICYRKTSFR